MYIFLRFWGAYWNEILANVHIVMNIRGTPLNPVVYFIVLSKSSRKRNG